MDSETATHLAQRPTVGAIAVLQPGQQAPTVHPNIFSGSQADIFAKLVAADTQATKEERSKNSAMATEMIKRCDQLMEKAKTHASNLRQLSLSIRNLRESAENLMRTLDDTATGTVAQYELAQP